MAFRTSSPLNIGSEFFSPLERLRCQQITFLEVDEVTVSQLDARGTQQALDERRPVPGDLLLAKPQPVQVDASFKLAGHRTQSKPLASVAPEADCSGVIRHAGPTPHPVIHPFGLPTRPVGAGLPAWEDPDDEAR